MSNKCNECKGKGKIELFTSWAECEECGGTGEISESGDHPEKRYEIQWDEAKDFVVIQDTHGFDPTPVGGTTFIDPNPITSTGSNPCGELPSSSPVSCSLPVPPEQEIPVLVLTGDQTIEEGTVVRITNEFGTLDISGTLHVETHMSLEDVADIEEVSLITNMNMDAFPFQILPGHSHAGKNTSIGCSIKEECAICQKKECKHLGKAKEDEADNEHKLDRDAKVSVSPRPSSYQPRVISSKGAGIEPMFPSLDRQYRKTYGSYSDRSRRFSRDLEQDSQWLMRQMLQGLRLYKKDEEDE